MDMDSCGENKCLPSGGDVRNPSSPEGVRCGSTGGYLEPEVGKKVRVNFSCTHCRNSSHILYCTSERWLFKWLQWWRGGFVVVHLLSYLMDGAWSRLT